MASPFSGPPLIDWTPLANLGKGLLDSYSKGKKEADEKRQTQAMLGAFDRSLGSGMSPLSPTSGSVGEQSGAGSDMSPVARIGSPTEIETRFLGGVKQAGLTNPIGLAAVAATGRAESGYSPQNANRTWSDPSVSGQPGQAGGIMSWRAERLQNLYRFAGQRGERPGNISPETQAAYLAAEDPQLIPRLNAARTPEEATQIMANAWRYAGYDKPGGQNAVRLAMTRQYMQRFGSSGTRGSASDEMIPGMVGAGSDADVEAPQPGMTASTFDAITGTNAPRTPAFAQAQAGASQPWMGSTLGALGTQPQTAMTPLPPRRPNDLANVPARGAVPAIGQVPPQAPQMAPQIDPNSPDAGSRTFAAAQAYAPQMAAPQAPQMSPTSGAPGAGGGAGAGGAPQMATRQNVNPDMIRSLIAAGGDARAMGMQLWQQALTGRNFGFQVVGDQLYRTDPRTGQVEPIQGATKPVAPVTVGETQSLIDPRTGAVIYRGQAGAPPTKSVKQADGSEVVLQWDGQKATWVPLVAPEGGNQVRPTGIKLTEAQSKDLVYHNRGLQALEVFEQPGISEALTSGAERVASAVPGGNYVVSEQFQKASQAGRNFLASVLRKDTGAAVTASEEKMYGEIFLPQPGDKPAVLEQKRVARAQALEAIKSGLGTAEVMAKASETVSSAKKAIQTPAPKRGDLIDGYRFKGGNPADEKNWVKVQ